MGARLSIVLMILSFTLIPFKTASAQENQRGDTMSGKNANRVEALFAKTKIVCVGRYVFNVPESASVVFGPASIPYPIQRYPGEGGSLNEIVAGIVHDALASKSKHPIGPASQPGSLVGNVISGINERHKIVYSVEKSTGVYYKLVSVLALEDDIYILDRSHFGESSELATVVMELMEITKRVAVRDDRDIKVGPGFCIDGAFVSDAGIPEYERVTLGVRLKEYNDVHLSIEMSLKDELVDSDALEPRLKSAEEEAKALGHGDWYARIKTFRRGQRQLGGWNGYEIVARKPPQAKTFASHEFAFVSQGEPKNPMLPVISISFYTGVKEDSVGGTAPSLSDDEAIQLWDRLLESLRLASSILK